MLNKLGSLGGVFGQKDLHPLADARELKRILDELPRDNAFRALDEIAGWFESLQATQEFAPDRIYEVARQLEEAAQPHLKRLSRDYLLTPRLTRADEKRLWSINFGFWKLLAGTYERCLAAVGEKNKAAEGLKAILPALCARLIGAYGAIIKWEQFHYGPTANELWRQMGHALLVAEAAGIAQKSVALGAQARLTSAWQEFQRAVVFQAASLDSLLPLEIELASRLFADLKGDAAGKPYLLDYTIYGSMAAAGDKKFDEALKEMTAARDQWKAKQPGVDGGTAVLPQYESFFEKTVPLLEKAEKLSTKSPYWAVFFSAIFPGGGHFFLGEWDTGIVSLSLVGGAAFLAYDGFMRDSTVQSILFTTFATGAYIGQAYSSYRTARKYNEELGDAEFRELNRQFRSLNVALQFQTRF